MTAMDRVLIIDDDVELCELVAEYLAQERLEVEAVHNGEEGIARALSGDHSLVVLDVMLPGMGGFDVLRRIRSESRIPVLMLTARGDDVDRIVGLELGADDYLPKPFNPRELVARIRAIFRRTQTPSIETKAETTAQNISLGDIDIDTGARVVRRAGEMVELTAAEFDLLVTLIRSAGRIVSREELAEAALGRPLSPLDRSIDMHVSNLRKKLGHQVGDFERIKAVRGAGYIYTLPSATESE